MEWRDLWAAVALYLVLEGLMPFLSPSALRRAFARLSQLDDRTIRIGGLLSMGAGLVLLFAVRSAGT
jgi:hypothetical protein